MRLIFICEVIISQRCRCPGADSRSRSEGLLYSRSPAIWAERWFTMMALAWAAIGIGMGCQPRHIGRQPPMRSRPKAKGRTWVCASANEPSLGGGYTLLGVAADDDSMLRSYHVAGVENVVEGRSYGMPSYSVYLSSRAAGKFVYNRSFSALGRHLGMFELDTKKKLLRTFDKSGCCWHIMEEFDVVNNRPRKVKEIVEDAIADPGSVKVTTKTLVNSRWRTQVKYEKLR